MRIDVPTMNSVGGAFRMLKLEGLRHPSGDYAKPRGVAIATEWVGAFGERHRGGGA
jgi:hypothetical protein